MSINLENLARSILTASINPAQTQAMTMTDEVRALRAENAKLKQEIDRLCNRIQQMREGI